MHQSVPVEHAQHDLELIAGHAAGDLTDSERTRADALLASCTTCADLRRDLVAIASATRSLPGLPGSPRDFRLTETQAASLRRGGWVKALLRPLAAPRSSVRPMAMAFTSLGIAGLFVANILPALFGSAASLAPNAGPAGGQPAPTAAAAPAASEAGAVPVAVAPQATDTQSRNNAEFGSLNQPSFVADGSGAGGSKTNEGTTSAPEVPMNAGHGSATAQPYSADRLAARERDLSVQDVNWVTIGSMVLLGLGLALFGLRFLARRVL